MAFYDLKIILIDGKRFREKNNKGNTDFKAKEYIHDDCPDDTIPMSSAANIIAKLAGSRPWKRSDIIQGKTPASFGAFQLLAERSRVNIITSEKNIELMRSRKHTHSDTKETYTFVLDDVEYTMVRNMPTYETVRVVLPTEEWNDLDQMLSNVFGADYRSNIQSGADTVLNMIQSLRKAYVAGNRIVHDFCEKYKDTTNARLKTLIIIPVTTGVPRQNGSSDKEHWLINVGAPIGNAGLERALYTRTNTHGILCAQVVSGVLHVKVSDKDIELFRNGPGVATFLDGGAAEIETLDLEYWNPSYDELPTPYTAK